MSFKSERYFAADNALRAFCESLARLDKSESRSFVCLFDFIEWWIEKDDGVRDCSEDYQIYLATVVLIIDWWNSGRVGDFGCIEDDTLFIPRRVTEVVNWNRRSSRILDLSYFQFWKVTAQENREQELKLLIRKNQAPRA